MVRPEVRRERSLGLFLLGLLLFSPALLSIFGLERFLAGLPLLYLYLFAAWAALIALMALNAGELKLPGRGGDDRRERASGRQSPRGGG